jgi:8-oxo-dGTP pyrophosphatase MutT (NUDIX family)
VTDRFEGYGVPRAFACVTRECAGGRELLVFDHPDAGTQLPKGRIDPGESHREAAIRELMEESGLALEPTRLIAHIEYEFLHPYTGELVAEEGYLWHFDAPADVSDSWVHHPIEEAMAFSYRWLLLDGTASDRVHPHFAEVVALTEQMFGRRARTR